MLYFCSRDEVLGVITVAPRFMDNVDRMRKSVTEDMNNYMRRTLDYATGIVEHFDSHDVEFGGSFGVWTEKKRIITSSVVVNYNGRRMFDGDNVIPAEDVMVHSEKGKIEIYGMTRKGRGTVRIQYNGGYEAVPGTDVMDCPSNLKEAAIAECSYRLDKLLNVNVGQSEDANGRQKSAQRKFIGNLLSDTAYALTGYRKPLGGIA